MLGVIPHLHLLFGCERRGSFRRRGGAPQSVLGRRKMGGPSKSRAAAPRAFNSGIAQEGNLFIWNFVSLLRIGDGRIPASSTPRSAPIDHDII